MSPPARSPARVARATLVAATVSGAPSTLHAMATAGIPGAARYGIEATRAIGSVVPPGRSGLGRGVLVHFAISIGAGAALARLLPRRHSLAWGAAAGAAMGVVNVGVIGRHLPLVRALPLGPQIADNVAFGVLFAAVVDHRCH